MALLTQGGDVIDIHAKFYHDKHSKTLIMGFLALFSSFTLSGHGRRRAGHLSMARVVSLERWENAAAPYCPETFPLPGTLPGPSTSTFSAELSSQPPPRALYRATRFSKDSIPTCRNACCTLYRFTSALCTCRKLSTPVS